MEGLQSTYQDINIKKPKREETSSKENFLNDDDFLCQQPEEKQIVNMNTTSSTRGQYQRSSFDDTTKFNVGSMTPDEIERKTESLCEKKDGVWSCLACDYTTSFNSDTCGWEGWI